MYDVICSSLILTIQLALNYGSLGWGIRTLNIMEYINLSFPWIVREDALEQNWLKTLWFLVRSTRIHDVVICSSHILTTQNCAKLWLQPRLRDMDMNQHVNNVKYISWVLEVCAARSVPLNSQKQLSNNACSNSSCVITCQHRPLSLTNFSKL